MEIIEIFFVVSRESKRPRHFVKKPDTNYTSFLSGASLRLIIHESQTKDQHRALDGLN